MSIIAGRLGFFLREWSQITLDPIIVSWLKGYKIPFNLKVSQIICLKVESGHIRNLGLSQN